MSFLDLFGKKNKKPQKPKYYDIVCPFCFERYNPQSVVFRATHNREDSEEFALQEDELLNNYRAKFNLGPLPDMEAIIYPDRIPEEKKRYADGVLVEVVDDEGIASSKRLCPMCHNELPITSGKVPGNIISIVGPSQVGKSVYMTALIHILQNFTANNYNAACLPVSVEVSRRFKSDFETAIYERGELLSSTRTIDKQEPLMFEFKFKDGSKDSVTLVFFDVAGEGMVDKGYLDIFGAHIKNSSGILFLVDPLQIKTIRDKISIRMEDNQGDFTGQFDEPRDVVISLFENFIGNQEGGRTDIPTAVVLTKSDMLKMLCEDGYIKENSNVFYNVTHKGVFNLTEFENINGEVRRLIDKVDRAFSDAIDVHFNNTAYFAVSALGSNPVDKKIQGMVNSVRVDEPFLWLLYRLGFIEGSRDR